MSLPLNSLHMPAILPAKFLGNRSNGFRVTVWVIQDLLEYGFSARGSTTVRSESNLVTYLHNVPPQ
ncbi:hypothetical protein L227DRAFT_580203 [Lentinus tigrinus ALCF2SS1-6]|uniref:Uncharacterized protein n=1 Tax=Lentinus tigrinus ALCF2SS1-6 TaxID=1328759 RepID=A0A5C2RU16_9APHY|nr:hypothetical protein L227DRAFT_580203 [Lentinus tigrinus ALCF2SS1-6]